jgi:hypothetical protein
VQEGLVGVLVVEKDMETVLSRVTPPAGAGPQSLTLVLETLSAGARIVFRNQTAANNRCVFVLSGIEVRSIGDPLRETSRLASVTTGDPPQLDLAKVSAAVVAGSTQSPEPVDIVEVSDLHARLGFARALDYPSASRGKSFLDWKMEVDDAPILRYLYRNFAPRRHLEFGTWSGTGACYCLEESAATVWTINLAEGEIINGAPAYSSAVDDAPEGAVPVQFVGDQPVYQTDAGMFVGRRYREAGFGHRVCQIYCDSRNWDTRAYPQDFFDSVLIDGGHTRDVVLSDTLKALSVTRPGALVMWHDFCPDPAVFATFNAVTGVIAALSENWTQIASSLRDVFWIQPSFLLVGLRR